MTCQCKADNLRRLCEPCRVRAGKPACAWCLGRGWRVLNMRWSRCDHTPGRVAA